ncbi:MAG: zinc carboxypeptidase [Planctomycetes bacterium]|nr:zinc carboxypeptidase [Planctomycetota bacterium]
MSMLFALSVAVSSVTQVAAQVRPQYHVVRIDDADASLRTGRFAELGFDHVAHDDATHEVEVVANDRELEALVRAGIPHRIAIDDLENFYAERLAASPKAGGAYGAWLSPAFASGSMGGYYTYTQVAAVLDQIHAAYPTLTTAKTSLGNSVEGRALWMLKISDNAAIDENEPEVRIDSLHHAREPEGMQASLWFVLYLLESYATDPLAKYLVDNREIFWVPVVNPDGYVFNQSTNPGGGGLWRKNRRNNGGGTFGVDLNRNYNNHWGFDNGGSSPVTSDETYRGPSAASEPEIQAMQNFIASRQFKSSLSIHTYSNLWLYPYGYAAIYPANNAQYVEVSDLATELNHYTIGPPPFVLYAANGVTADYDHDAKGTLAWSPEVGSTSDGFWPPSNRIVPLADEMLLAQQRTALAAGAWMRVLSTSSIELGDGDGFYEPGESVQLGATVRNSGRAASGTSVTLAVTSSSPYASITNGSYDFGVVGAFSQAASGPVTIAIAPNAPGGAALDYTLTLAYEGWSQTIAGSIQLGKPVTLVLDDAESILGWTTGVVGDTATSGLWTRGSPIGTNSSGTPANPAADASAAPGVNCYLTGNGGGSAGTDDVDGGTTTLLSPIFDLEHCGPAVLSFARWFADLSVVDDTFAASISNDGGASWSPLENVTVNANAWNTVDFTVGSILPQTSQMRLRFTATDNPNNSVVEAAVDDLRIEIFDSHARLALYGKPALGGSVSAFVTGPAGAVIQLQSTLADPFATFGAGQLAHRFQVGVNVGTIPASGLARLATTLPSTPLLAGKRLWYRALVKSGANVQLTNWSSLQLP